MQELHVSLTSHEEQRQDFMGSEVHSQEYDYAIKVFVMHCIGVARRFHRNRLAERVASESCLDEMMGTSLIYVCPQCYQFTVTDRRICSCGYGKGTIMIKATFSLALIKKEG